MQAGYFLDIFHKYSDLPGVPDKVSMTFVAGGARLLAIDENGPSEHVNSVGKGMLYYGKNADHPHVHVPVPESSSGYAEPIDRTAQRRAFYFRPVTPSSHPPSTMRSAKRIWPRLQRARPSAGLFHSGGHAFFTRMRVVSILLLARPLARYPIAGFSLSAAPEEYKSTLAALPFTNG